MTVIRWITISFLLVWKEVTLEARGRELLALLVCGSVITAALVGAGVSSAMLDYETTKKLFPTFLWIVFVLSTTSASARAQESELEGRGYEGLFLVGVTGTQIYLSKVLVTAFIFLLDWCLLVLLMALALDQNVVDHIASLLSIGACASLALAALIVLLAAVSGTSRMRGALLPLLTIPLLFPLFFSGVELTYIAMVSGVFEGSSVWYSAFLLSFTIFVLVGINTYDRVIRE